MKLWLLRGYRMAVLLAAAGLIRAQANWRAAQQLPVVSLAQVQKVLPKAATLGKIDLERGGQFVVNAGGETIGYTLSTAPMADGITGYSGPSNLLVGLDAQGVVTGVTILSSQDTPEHVELVRSEPKFLEQFRGWHPAEGDLEKVDGVSGATLTSLAMAEAVQFRLRGGAPSWRFPEPVTLGEVRKHLPQAAAMQEVSGRWQISDAEGRVLGMALRTSPSADQVSGYRGPTDCLILLETDGQTVRLLTIRKSFDNASYVQQVTEDPTYLPSFAGRTLETLASLDYEKEGVEGVSGSTLTSYAIAESLKRRARTALQTSSVSGPQFTFSWRDVLLAVLVLGATILSFSHLRGLRWVRRAWQIVLVTGLGVLLRDFVSLALLGGWASHGVRWQAAPGLLALAAAAVAFPWFTRHQVYCHHLCPHGAAQQLLGGLRRRKFAVSSSWDRALRPVPILLLALALGALVIGWPLNLAALEPFHAWVFKAGAIASTMLAVLGLAASIFVPQAYCRYGCPTGALLGFLRSAGRHDHFSRKDWVALALLGLAGALSLPRLIG